MIQLITDSTCDMTHEELNKLNIMALPLTIHFEQDSFRDGIDLDSKSFYVKLRQAKSLPTTSQVPPGEFEAAYRPILERGDDIVVITIAFKLSATYQSAVSAAQSTDPERVHVVDSMSGSFGTQLLLHRAVMLRDQGKMTAREIAEDLQALAPRVRLYAVVDTLKYLKMGGRLSGSAALIGELLGIKPLVVVDGGVVHNIAKIRGDRKVVKALYDHFMEAKPDLSYGVSFGNSVAVPLMETAIEYFKPTLGDTPIYRSDLGAVIGTHVGPGVVGVGFIKSE